MSKMQGDVGLSKCQVFGISPISRLRLWRWPGHIFDDGLNDFEAIKKRDCGPVFCSESLKVKQAVAE